MEHSRPKTELSVFKYKFKRALYAPDNILHALIVQQAYSCFMSHISNVPNDDDKELSSIYRD